MKIPVTLLTGFLGSGKTTVLNQMVKDQISKRFMVIENEVGKVNIDGALVESGVEDVLELTAGCLCCSLSDGLLDALEIVSAKKADFDQLIIETTGVADPSSIAQVFLTDPMVGRYFDLKQIICVVDAGLIEEWLEETEEALRQISMADVILLNKVDTVNTKYLSELEHKVKSVNPFAEVFSGENGIFPFTEILDVNITDLSSFENRQNLLIQQQDQQQMTNKIDHIHKVNTFTLTFEQPFVLDDYFSLQLFRLVNLYREQVYRIKGILHLSNHPNQVIIQSVRTSCVITDGRPWLPSEDKVSHLVFIGRGLQKEAFQKMLGRYTKTVEYDHVQS